MPAKAPAARAPRARVPAKRARPAASPPPAQSPTPEATALNPLQASIAGVFAAAQKTTAGHRKLAINLRTTYEQCVDGTGSIGSAYPGGGHKYFVRELFRFLARILIVKRSEVVGDRCIKFADLFMRTLLEKGKDHVSQHMWIYGLITPEKPKPKRPKDPTDPGQAQDSEPEDDAPAQGFIPKAVHRFVLRLLTHVQQYTASVDKSVRYRATQFLALLLANTLIEYPYEYSEAAHTVFLGLRVELLGRLRDKEAAVRVQAAIAVCRLLEMGVGEGDDDEDEDGNPLKGTALLILLDSLQNDASADVRRTILHNIPATPASLSYLLERARDTDANIRRSVYTQLLPLLGDFRHLSISMREKLLRWGLNDRNESVRLAASKIFNYRWIEDAGGDLLEVLERLDVTGDGVEGGVKELALQGFWGERKDVVEQIVFDDEYFEHLSAESAFLVRSFNDYCRSAPDAQGMREVLEEKMPEVTKLAFYLQRYLNKLVAALEAEDEESAELEFIVTQMLMIAARTDYGDEIGRRKMFSLLRESLSIPELTEGVTKLVVECLEKLSMGEGDFCMLVLEVIAEIHDRIVDDDEAEGEDFPGNESFHSAQSDIDSMEDTITVNPTPVKKGKKKNPAKPKKKGKKAPPPQDEDVDMMDVDEAPAEPEEDTEKDSELDDEEAAERKALQEVLINLKCLHIAQCMLELVGGSLKQNTHLVTMLNGLIVPAVQSHEAPVRERALRCLGLSCLLDRTLAQENLTLFAHCISRGHSGLQIEALHIMSDILTTHTSAIFDGDSCPVEQKVLYRMFAKGLKNDDAVEVQATAAEVVCKLMLAQVIKDEELLKVMLVAYFDPATIDNQGLRQILTYFFPVYCHSRPENQSRMAKVTVQTVHALILLREGLGEEEEMVPAAAIAGQLAEWTDPRKNVGGGVQAGRGGIEEKIVDPNVQVDLAAEILERLSGEKMSKEEKKLLISLLAKLYIPSDADPEKLRAVYDLVAQAIEDKIATDAPSRNALNKLEVTLGKIVGDIAAAAREDTMIVPAGEETDATGAETEEEGAAVAVGKGGEESEVESVAGTAMEEDEDEEGDVTVRQGDVDGEGGEEEEEEEEDE